MAKAKKQQEAPFEEGLIETKKEVPTFEQIVTTELTKFDAVTPKIEELSAQFLPLRIASIEDKEGYEDSETKEFDDIAMNYMFYLAIPLIGCYAVYSLFYNEHKSWYSFILNTLVGCIYTFGFINMVP